MTLNSKVSLANELEISEFELSKYIFRADYLYKRFSIPKSPVDRDTSLRHLES